MKAIQGVIGWWDDRFYKCKLTQKEIDGIVKRAKEVNPNFEYTIVDKNIFLPSSTTILGSAPKEWLARWRGQVGNWEADRIMNEAMNKGSRVHSAFAEYLNGTVIILNNPKAPAYTKEQITAIETESKKGVMVLQDQQEMLELWRLDKFFNILKPKVIGTEMSVYSAVYGYAGTLDHLWYIEAGKYDLGDKVTFEIEKSGNYVLDIKTGGEDGNNYPEQLASYYNAVEETGEMKVDGAIILYSNAQTKKGIEGFKATQISVSELQYHFKGFIWQYNIWLKKANKSPQVFDLPSLIRMN